jgi:hypothetical protein
MRGNTEFLGWRISRLQGLSSHDLSASPWRNYFGKLVSNKTCTDSALRGFETMRPACYRAQIRLVTLNPSITRVTKQWSDHPLYVSKWMLYNPPPPPLPAGMYVYVPRSQPLWLILPYEQNPVPCVNRVSAWFMFQRTEVFRLDGPTTCITLYCKFDRN